MKTIIISEEQAKVLKEAGFNRKFPYTYDANGNLNDRLTFKNDDSHGLVCAPKLFEIFDWLHQEKKIVIDFKFSRRPNNLEDSDLITKVVEEGRKVDINEW